jgi:EmrB/QacA subfamily drug resistance transporter
MTAEIAAAEDGGASRLGALAQLGLLAGPFLSMIDSSVVNVAVPSMARSFGAPLSQLQWVISGYLLALAAGLAASAWLARRYGTRQVYLASLAGFLLLSLACALAGSTGWLITARVLQGLVGAPMTPLAMGMMFGREDGRNQLSPAAGLALFLPPALGPAIGGFLVAHSGWQSIFLINLPVGLLAIAGVQRLPRSLAPGRDRTAGFDPGGLALVSAGLALTSYGVISGPADGWLSGRSWPLWVTGLALLGCYAVWARRRREPAVSLRLLSARGPALAIGLSVVAAVILFAALFLIPAYVEQVQGLSAAEAGLILLPQGLVMAAGTIAGDVLSRRRLVKETAVAGTLILALSTALLLLVQAATPGWITALLLCGRGLALGLIIQPLLVATLAGLPEAELADANTLFNIVDRIGGSFGVGLIATFFQASVLAHLRAAGSRLGPGAPTAGPPAQGAHGLLNAGTAAFHDTVWVLVVVAGLAVALALAIPRRTGCQSA